MKFSELIACLGDDAQIMNMTPEADITGITYDSRKVLPGFCFAAIPGEKTDGHLYIKDAVDQGAVAILLENITPEITAVTKGLPIIKSADSRKAMALLAACF